MADYTAPDHPAVVDLLVIGGGVIGTPATPEYADWIHRQISAAVPVPVLYGGSVDPNNSLEFAKLRSVAGLLIGRSAWNVEGYLEIVEEATKVRFGA